MKNSMALLLLLLMVACQTPAGEGSEAEVADAKESEEEYDAALAEKYGADDYGMKQYVMAFLKRGPNRDQDSLTAANLQAAHMENIGRMAEAGQLVVAGPFLNDGELRGIYIFNVSTVEEAEALTNTDPAIQAGSLVMELLPWYGSAAMMGINEQHQRLAKVKF